MGDDRVCLACHRKLEKEFICRVWQERPYADVNLCFPANEAESMNDSLDNAFWNLEKLSLALSDGLVFENQGNGNQRNPTLAKPLQDGE